LTITFLLPQASKIKKSLSKHENPKRFHRRYDRSCSVIEGLKQVVHVFQKPGLLLAGVGVGICASVIPYVCDQLATARLPRESFSILLALLPANATLIGAIVLKQIPSWRDIAGIALVVAGVALHQSSAPRRTENKQLFAKRLEASGAEMDPS
jgi:hypothetical protein